jgi:hypothetical protein
MILPEIAVPVVIGVWAWLRLRGAPWARWVVGATLYVAYAAVAARLAAPLPSGLVLSWVASLANQLAGRGAGTFAPQGFAPMVGKAWLGLAVVPAVLILAATAALARVERRARRRGRAAGAPTPPPLDEPAARILRLPKRRPRDGGPGSPAA